MSTTPQEETPNTFTKRDATPEEEKVAIAYYSLALEKDYTEDIEECKKEGYKTEVCSCGRVFPLFIHLIRCDECTCPMKGNGPSLLEAMLGLDERVEEETNNE